MRKRKLAVVSFLAAAALTCGIGYAAVSDTLDMVGTFDINGNNAFNEDIYFKSAGAESPVGYTASVVTNDPDKATFTITGMSGKGDTLTIPFVIVNKGDIEATVSVMAIPTATQDSMYQITTDWGTQTKTLNAHNEETGADGELTINLTVELLKTPTDDLVDTFTVQLTASAD
ncbi:MAG: hypothetical protein IJ506_04700 [Clostridia bacterium]|nr:hypothetical protein [Clostridia bacterium]